MGVRGVFVVAAVPLPPDVGVQERRSAFWLNRLFVSRRKRKLSRDIGTCITEEELEQESPPASPAGAGAVTSLPDLITSCRRLPAAQAGVFVFPETGGAVAGAVGGAAGGSPAEVSPELRCRLSGLDADSATPRGGGGGGGGPLAPADAEMREVGRCLRRCADEFEMSRRARSAAAAAAGSRPLAVERLAAGALVAATAVCVCRRLYR